MSAERADVIVAPALKNGTAAYETDGIARIWGAAGYASVGQFWAVGAGGPSPCVRAASTITVDDRGRNHWRELFAQAPDLPD
jgi:hypothetical protein